VLQTCDKELHQQAVLHHPLGMHRSGFNWQTASTQSQLSATLTPSFTHIIYTWTHLLLSNERENPFISAAYKININKYNAVLF
jgi:alanine racemase